jgi:hypothetical protein
MTHRHTDNFKLKQKHKADFDPCGFIHYGAPIDEYDCLTNQLLSAAYASKTRNEIKDLILHEIEHHFGTPDLEILDEPHKTNFYNDIEKLIDKLEQLIEK